MRHTMMSILVATWLSLPAPAEAEPLLANPELRAGADGTVENWTLYDLRTKGREAKCPTLSDGRMLLGRGGGYRLTSAPFPVRERTWLRAGARVSIERGSAGKIAMIGYLLWSDAEGKPRSRTGFGNVPDVREGVRCSSQVIEEVIRVPRGAATARFDVSSRSFNGQVFVQQTWCSPDEAGPLYDVTQAVGSNRLAGWVGRYGASTGPGGSAQMLIEDGGVVWSTPFRWKDVAGDVLVMDFGDVKLYPSMAVELRHYRELPGRNIKREGLGYARGAPKQFIKEGVRPAPGAVWGRLRIDFGKASSGVIRGIRVTTHEQMRLAREKHYEPVRDRFVNGGFERIGKDGQPVGWLGLFRPIRHRAEGALEGKRCLVIETQEHDTEEIVSDFFRVPPGSKVTVSLAYRVDRFEGVSALSPTIKWYQFPTERLSLGGAYIGNANEAGKLGEWQTMGIAAEVPTKPRPVYYARIQLKNDRSRCRVLVARVRVGVE